MKKFAFVLILVLPHVATASPYARGGDWGGGSAIVGLFVLGAILYGAFKVLARMIGEELAGSIAIGAVFAFFLGVIPITLVGAAHLVFHFSNLPTILGYTALVWCLACIIFQVRVNWPAIAKERAKRAGQSP
jgi:hypothetical protein